MKIIADLHLHSKYSRAVSQQMVPQVMAQWAVKKGINLLGTADWTHPLWLKELEANLEEQEEGIFKLKDIKNPTSFILSTEISCIYSQAGKVRRIHLVVMAPSFATVHAINDKLKGRGANLISDGRPIIGLSAKELAELIWSIDKNCFIIPAHVWTPWFSLYGSKSGFDSMDDCFSFLANHIYSVETGLSSDPAMNWSITELDKRSIVSFSDAHSPAKMGREATVFKTKSKNGSFSYKNLASALKQDPTGNWEISYTVEFHPEEGKYHYTGHRQCGIRQSPQETRKKGTTCPVCGKPLTVGVMHRVSELAKRKVELKKVSNDVGLMGYYDKNNSLRPPYIMLVPLIEILSESLNTSASSQKTKNEYDKLISQLGSELDILTQIKLEDISRNSGARLAEGIDRVRRGEIVVEPGFDGVFGIVRIWPTSDKKSTDQAAIQQAKEKKEQMSIF